MEEIARLAGVSKAAVSLALSGKSGVGTGTRERILQIAGERGYLPKNRSKPPDGPAKSLTFLVVTNSGIVLEEYDRQPFFRELIHFIQDRRRAKGFSLLFSTIHIDTFEQDIGLLAEENRSGVILLGTNLNRGQIAAIAAKLPHLVVLDTCFDSSPVHFVEINNFLGGYQAGGYICRQGHRRIGYIESSVRIHNFEERMRGFKTALEEHGARIGDGMLFSVAPTILSSQEALRKRLEQFIRSGRDFPTALFCECDYIAISAMKTLAELGFRIPEDVSVVGFDNIFESVVVSPELTTVQVEKGRMAQLAVDLLTDSMDAGPPVKTKIKVDTHFIERHSCGPLANSSRENGDCI
ncbi:LacI family DNA-binding transcriptional regulator [Paenibacillus sp. P25]|nr:LacI family DNA-binding transcriptional regulator [Paenibacillus sp. P25]